MGQSALCRFPDHPGAASELEVVTVPGPGSSALCASFPILCGVPSEDHRSIPKDQEHVTVNAECCLQSPREPGYKKKVVVVAHGRQFSAAPPPESKPVPGPLSRTWLLQPQTEHRFRDYYKVGRKLGEGSFGDVYEARLRPVDKTTGRPIDSSVIQAALAAECLNVPADGATSPLAVSSSRQVAVKVFTIVPPGPEVTTPRGRQELTKRRLSFEAERSMLASLEHPHIVRMYECFQEEDALYIVLEQCRGGELYGRLVSISRQAGGGGMDEDLARVLFRQMLQAVSYLHARRIVHRDIKTENFLLLGEPNTPEANVLKLCDFGTATVLSDERPRSMENIGTLSYTAPEVYASRGAAVAADAWSLGVVLYVLVTGTNPFRVPGNTSREDTVRRIKLGQYEQRRNSWLSLSPSVQDLVRSCLVLEEAKRFTCVQALRHPWLATTERPLTPMGLADPPGLQEHVPRVVALLQRLPRMAEAQRLALAACALAASEADIATPEEVPWRDLFLAMDQDQDGQLSFPELVAGLKRLLGSAASQLPDHKLEECARALDLDQSGAIEWVEFVAVAVLASRAVSEAAEPLSTAFRLLDRRPADPGDSSISGEEASTIIGNWIPRELQVIVQEDGEEPAPGPRLTLADLRYVLRSTEVYEML